MDPQELVGGFFRMVRGGDWDDNAYGGRSANSGGYPDLGFRVLLAPAQ